MRSAESVPVRLGAASYTIHIDRGNLNQLGPLMRERGYADPTAVVTHPLLRKLYGEAVETSLRSAGFDPIFVEVPEGEATKSWAWAGKIFDPLFAHRLDRKCALVALGGGVVGDLTGFVAATYMRGIAFVQVPTTLLAQVDASVGGKTAVNHPKGKNLIGAFHQPSLVLIDVETLDSLPQRDYLAGLVEIVKHGVIMDEPLFRFIESHVEPILRRDPTTLTPLIAQSCRDKASIVEKDEREAGLRALLNYGHTFGHAIESLTDYDSYRHGEAVAIGMACAAAFSVTRGCMSPSEQQRQNRLLRALGLRLQLPDLTPTQIVEAMVLDKKTERGQLRLVLAKRIGEAFISDDVEPEDVKTAIQQVRDSDAQASTAEDAVAPVVL